MLHVQTLVNARSDTEDTLSAGRERDSGKGDARAEATGVPFFTVSLGTASLHLYKPVSRCVRVCVKSMCIVCLKALNGTSLEYATRQTKTSAP